MDILVTKDGLRLPSGEITRCAIGRGGIHLEKKEGDGVTPIGDWVLRRIFYRPDRISPPTTALPIAPIAIDDGWCDAPGDPRYNILIKRPYPASHEAMWRDDHLYDLVVILGHNDNPPIAGQGSAIFLHVAKADYSPTEGCVALPLDVLTNLLKSCRPGDRLSIR